MGIRDFLRYRDGKTVYINYIDTGERIPFVIGRDIDREDLDGRIDKETGELYAVTYRDTNGEILTQLINPEDRDIWTR